MRNAVLKSPLELLRGWDEIGTGTSFVGAAPLGGLSSSEFSSAELSPPELDKAKSFLLQPSSKPTICG